MTPPNDAAQRRWERAARRYERSQRHAGDRGSGYSPNISGSTPWADQEEREFWTNREVEMLQRALADRGEMRRGELGKAVGCKYWGPGRFSSALRAAVARGAIEHTGFGRYGPKRESGGGETRDAGDGESARS
jgi:hypothetical protein